MARFRKLPVVIDAFHLGTDPMPDWFMDEVSRDHVILRLDQSIDIRTLEGWLHGTEGDWIIRGIHQEIYPCKPDIFVATYSEVTDD